MPARNISLYLDAEAEERIESRQRSDRDRSATVARMIERYAELCQRDRPNLTEAEWNLVRDALRGTWFEPWSIAHVDDELPEPVRSKLGRLTYGQALAIVDDAERFWASKR